MAESSCGIHRMMETPLLPVLRTDEEVGGLKTVTRSPVNSANCPLDRKERAVNSGGSLVAKYKFVDEYDRPIYVPDHRSFVVIECYGSNASALRPVAASSTIMKQSSTIFKVQLGKVSGPMWCESPNHRPSEKINVRLDYEPCKFIS
ncbi:unnamed protein product [Soboliphyme baturini]|uniref:ZP domain-containing protein n=1 Tax=Soboliphyme baturini TaxID=241478 RepID=A0A183J958_9BILA|nr:unnamed protein product [Soboliphyme baturini]